MIKKSLSSILFAGALFVPVMFYSVDASAEQSKVYTQSGKGRTVSKKDIAKMEKQLAELGKKSSRLEKEIRDLNEEYTSLATEYYLSSTSEKRRKTLEKKCTKIKERLNTLNHKYQNIAIEYRGLSVSLATINNQQHSNNHQYSINTDRGNFIISDGKSTFYLYSDDTLPEAQVQQWNQINQEAQQYWALQNQKAQQQWAQSQQEAEQIRKETELFWTQCEQIRQQQTEQARKQGEEARKQAEQARRQGKEARKQAEQARKQAEMARKQAEMNRKQAEMVRKQAEMNRKQAEFSRKQADIDRKQTRQKNNYTAWGTTVNNTTSKSQHNNVDISDYFRRQDPYMDMYINQLTAKEGRLPKAVVRRIAYNNDMLEVNIYLLSQTPESLSTAVLRYGNSTFPAYALQIMPLNYKDKPYLKLYGISLYFKGNYSIISQDDTDAGIEMNLSTGKYTLPVDTMFPYSSREGRNINLSDYESIKQDRYSDPIYLTPENDKVGKQNGVMIIDPLKINGKGEKNRNNGKTSTTEKEEKRTPIDPMKF